MNANELADFLEENMMVAGVLLGDVTIASIILTIRKQQTEIEDLKNANRFIQNFAEEQHQRAVALEMRELTDEEIIKVYEDMLGVASAKGSAIDFARAILRKAREQ